MHKIIVSLLLLKSIFCVGQGVSFTIIGKFPKNSNSEILYINGDSIKFSANKTFQYHGKIEKPSLVLFRTEDTYNNAVWCEGGIIKIDLSQYTKHGQGNTANKYLKIESLQGPAETEAYQKLLRVYEKIASQHPSRDLLGVDSLMVQFFPYVKEFVRNRPKSYLSASLLSMYSFTNGEKKELFALMQDNPDKETLDIIKTQIERNDLTKRGIIVSDFNQPTPEGKNFNLYALSKPYVLIQFWSSDCMPCRWEHPQLIELYNQYKPKGFEIVGISLDNKSADWQQAIEKDHLPWIQVSDLSAWKNEVAVRYKVDHIPFNILVDSSFKILATELWPNQIKEVLEHLYK